MSNQNFEEVLRQEVRRLAKKKLAEGMLEETVVNWMLDKVSSFVKGHFNNVKDYQYARLVSDPKFRSLHKKYGMSEKEFMATATSMLKRNPDELFKALAYDVRKGAFGKYFK